MSGAWSLQTHVTGPQSAVFNGDMLKKAREARGLSVEQLSKLTKISHGFLEAVENGFMSILPTDEAIVCNVLDFPAPFFYRTTVRLENPAMVFWDGDGIFPCVECGCVADFLCDYPLGHRTCDAHICEKHRNRVGDYDLCGFHMEQTTHASRYFDSGAGI